MVATAIEIIANLSPSFFTITSAIFSAEPVLISAPARIPDVRIRKTEDIIPCAPLIIVLTVPVSPPPPMNPPINAPRIRLYAGWTFLIIKIIAITSPIKAPKVVNSIIYSNLMFYNDENVRIVRNTCSAVSAIF